MRAFNPWPVAQTRFEDAFLRVWRAHAISGVGGGPGTVMMMPRAAACDVMTGDGLLRITELQLPGKRAMSAQDFISANNIQGTLAADPRVAAVSKCAGRARRRSLDHVPRRGRCSRQTTALAGTQFRGAAGIAVSMP